MKTIKTNGLINDGQSLVGAKSKFGHDVPTYDDGYGPLWVHRDSMGISGIVRAKTWEDAYGICEDEFFPEASETVEELRKEYNFTRRHAKIVREANGTEREAVYPVDYPDGRLSKDLTFLRFETFTKPAQDENAWVENELFCEAYGFRPNGPNSKDTVKHGIYSKDLNGDSLERLTPELLAELEITLDIQDES